MVGYHPDLAPLLQPIDSIQRYYCLMPRRITDAEREARYVVKREGCWVWLGAHTRAGYAIFTADYTNQYAHRWIYQRYIGEIPDGLTLDHLCHDPKECVGGKTCPHRGCVNPRHMKPVTRGANVAPGRSSRHHDRQRDGSVPL